MPSPPGKRRVFRSIFLKTLRDYRVAILGWGIGMGLVIVSPMASVATLINTPQARAALAALATQFAWNADPIAADTVGGYATFKIGIFIFLIVVGPRLAGRPPVRAADEGSSRAREARRDVDRAPVHRRDRGRDRLWRRSGVQG